MKENFSDEGASADPRFGIGQLLGDFPDVRAAPARIVGAVFGVPGLALLAAVFVPGWEPPALIGVCLLIPGAAAFALGTWRNYNRLLVYTGGLVHKKRGKTTRYLWRDIEGIAVEQEERHGRIGMIPYVTFPRTCTARGKDGVWVKIYLPPLSALAFKALRASWDGWSLTEGGGHPATGQARTFRIVIPGPTFED
jgi:hypothetical protein